MKHANYITLKSDKLVIMKREIVTGNVTRQGKRVASSCPLTYEERRAYVKDGAFAAIRIIKRRVKSLQEAMAILNNARY